MHMSVRLSIYHTNHFVNHSNQPSRHSHPPFNQSHDQYWVICYHTPFNINILFVNGHPTIHLSTIVLCSFLHINPSFHTRICWYTPIFQSIYPISFINVHLSNNIQHVEYHQPTDPSHDQCSIIHSHPAFNRSHDQYWVIRYHPPFNISNTPSISPA
jgi:hypothetical protein